MLPGGLSATYWDNQWLFGAPAVQRVDAQVCCSLVVLWDSVFGTETDYVGLFVGFLHGEFDPYSL